MKKATRTSSSSPPLHVHVNETTPVHVHMKKSTKCSPTKTALIKTKSGLHPTAKVKTRVPWIPPGKTSTRETSYKWEGQTHRLEITPPQEPERTQSPLRIEDLSTDEEEVLHGRINQYERKIDSLMSEVSSLKNEVELRKKEQLLERQSERLSASQRVIAEQEEELAEVARELEATEQENSRLRESMGKMLVENDYGRLERDSMQLDKDVLLRKLLEAEMDSSAAAKQVSALRETVNHMSRSGSEKKMSGSDSTVLARQKELLLQKLETFEITNRALRHLLREQHSREMDSQRLLEQKDELLKRLSDVEEDNSRILVTLQDKEREIDQLTSLLESEKESAQTTSELSKVLESTRAHLQGQLRNKEGENNRLNVQIRNLERSISQQQGEIDHLQNQLRDLRQQAEADKEGLKKATRAQKQRAQRSEETVAQLSAQLMEIEAQLADAVSAAENWSSRHAKEMKDKGQLETEIALLNSRITDLTEQLHGQEEKARTEREGLLDRLHELNNESTTIRLENQSLKATSSALEEKLSLSQSEVQQVKVSVKQYESLVDSYKAQVQKTRSEADEYSARLQVAESEAQTVRDELDQEIQQVKKQLHCRLAELEPLPEALRHAELQLQEAHEKERLQERRNAELSTSLAELRIKAEQQGSLAEMLRHKNMLLLEENKQLHHKAEGLERSVTSSFYPSLIVCHLC
ncbi:outer dense fiber protein [Pimephales promelas]|nr:outer dense fiber protein [Pimephales promelas]KAG1928142.1 outer dense fiber protein [Pimephales promelas]